MSSAETEVSEMAPDAALMRELLSLVSVSDPVCALRLKETVLRDSVADDDGPSREKRGDVKDPVYARIKLSVLMLNVCSAVVMVKRLAVRSDNATEV